MIFLKNYKAALPKIHFFCSMMKRFLLLVCIVSFGFTACNSNKGSYEENEKKIQDNLDNLMTDKGFDEILKNDSLAKDSLDKLNRNK